MYFITFSPRAENEFPPFFPYAAVGNQNQSHWSCINNVGSGSGGREGGAWTAMMSVVQRGVRREGDDDVANIIFHCRVILFVSSILSLMDKKQWM